MIDDIYFKALKFISTNEKVTSKYGCINVPFFVLISYIWFEILYISKK